MNIHTKNLGHHTPQSRSPSASRNSFVKFSIQLKLEITASNKLLNWWWDSVRRSMKCAHADWPAADVQWPECNERNYNVIIQKVIWTCTRDADASNFHFRRYRRLRPFAHSFANHFNFAQRVLLNKQYDCLLTWFVWGLHLPSAFNHYLIRKLPFSSAIASFSSTFIATTSFGWLANYAIPHRHSLTPHIISTSTLFFLNWERSKKPPYKMTKLKWKTGPTGKKNEKKW